MNTLTRTKGAPADAEPIDLGPLRDVTFPREDMACVLVFERATLALHPQDRHARMVATLLKHATADDEGG